MEVARLTTVLDAQADSLFSSLRNATSAGQAFAVAMGASLALVSAAAVKVGLVMDDALDTIRIRTGQTGAALEGLGDSFRDVFRAGPEGAQQVSDALSTLRSRTGQTGDSLETLTTQILTLSRITKTDLNSNVADSARLFTSWGIAASEQGNTLDLLFRTYQQTGVSIDSLLGKMVTAGPVFRAAGFDFATSAALLGGFEQAGVSGERVIASMTAAWRFFGKNQIDAQTGIRDTIARIQQLGPGAEAAALGVKVFGRGAVDMVAAIQSGRLNVDALVSTISNGTDTIDAAARATDGFAENLQIMGKRAFLALEPFGTAILETFNRGLLAVLEPSRGLTDALYLMGKAAVVVASNVVGRMVPALALAVRGYVASTAAVIANTVAMLRNATAAGVLSGAAGVLRGALAFFGGPWGLAVTAALTAVGVGFLNAGRRARQAAADARQAAADFKTAIAGMDEATFSATAAVVRSNYGALQRASARQQQIVRQLEARRAAGEPTSVAVQTGFSGQAPTFTNVLTPLGRDLATATARLETFNDRWRETAAQVRNVREQEQALAGFRATTTGTGGTGEGALDWEGAGAAAEAGRSVVDLLRERLDLLASVTESEQALGRVGTASQQALTTEYQRAEAMLRAMGDAASLPDSALQGYRDLLDLVNRFRPETVRPTANLQAAVPIVNLAAAAAQVGATNTRAASLFVAQQATRIERALKEGAAAAAARLKEATDNIRRAFVGLADSLPGVADARAGFNAARAGGAGVGASVAAGAGMAVAMEFLAGVAESLAPALEALLLPVRMLGETFGRALVPIARALFPTFRLVAIAASVVGEVFFRVAGAINVAIGGLVRGIGRILNALPGSLGNPLIALGQSMLDMGRGFQEGAEELARARDDLRALDFDEAARRVNESAGRLSESLSNVPPIFDLALRRMQAGRATAGAGGPAPAPSPAPPLPPAVGGSGGQPVHVYVTNEYHIDGRGAASDRELLRLIDEHQARRLRSGGDNELKNAVRAAVLGNR